MLAYYLMVEVVQGDFGAMLVLVMIQDDMRLLLTFAGCFQQLRYLRDLRIQVLLLRRVYELLFPGPVDCHLRMISTVSRRYRIGY